MIKLSVMNTYKLCALAAALTVPALVQPAMAEEASPAEEFVTSMFELQGAFAEVAEAIAEEEATPAEGAAAINEVTAACEALMAALPQLPAADQAEIGAILENEEVQEAAAEVEAGCLEILKAFKEADFFDCAELKAACVKFAAVNDYAM